MNVFSNFLKLIIVFMSLETVFPVFPEHSLVSGTSKALSEIFFLYWLNLKKKKITFILEYLEFFGEMMVWPLI